ncbi:PH domain-containing protein [Stackebrandtia nassauensis]|uniref:Membrane-flanked domain protein n=1 Tax=Stackebrandtia nassauensis (strain DSM 44728 / CIP 108903 / NRRL B-16338 / NBRC 102104 / LLR-40K-21) TaxID=446470 RepID=D3QAR1_STANL|nr:PH domain-containing protein [Stackebrandtia nassauensis]ADD44707.1 membrane-flanked domain protein [Stackebrandtia nassauensis DSM 44728]
MTGEGPTNAPGGPALSPDAAEPRGGTSEPGGPAETDARSAVDGWRRLDSRVLWVDTVRAILSLIPGGLAVFVFGQEINGFFIGSALVATAAGVLGAVADFLRWFKTRYRVTSDHIELRTGLLFRKHRTVKLDRIRSIDAKAKLRHRLAGLRILRIEAGQQGSAGESAFALDAVSKETARRLRVELLHRAPAPAATETETEPDAESAPESMSDETTLATFRWQWIVHNIFTIWAYLVAAGLVWGGNALAGLFGGEPVDWALSLLGWQGFTHLPSLLSVTIALGVLGVAGLAFAFMTENWGFRLTRVTDPANSTLRTEKGLFSTREVNRDENRLRGVQISQPLLWRWLGTADTAAISTGLSQWGEASQLLPRTPIATARAVAARVLPDAEALFSRRLVRHPWAALRRRLVRATVTTAVVTGIAAYLGATVPGFPDTVWIYCGLILWPLALGLAVASYLSLGHAVSGDYVVTRSGSLSAATAVLRRQAIIGWTFKQSLFQRLAGLMSVEATTAAGDKEYSVPDAAEADALRFADAALPGLVRPFLETDRQRYLPGQR